MVKDNNIPNFIKFVSTHLVGKAREALPENPQSVKEIIDALKKEIKFESSRVIEGKITALRVDKRGTGRFAEQAEKLAEEFRRSLIFEGHTKAKAQEMTVRKTVELCYKSTRSDTVKAVLAATSFETPSEVVSKFVVQQDTVRQDSWANKNNNGGSGYQNRRPGRGGRGNYRNNFQRNQNNSNQNRNYGQNRGSNNSGRGYRGHRSYRNNNGNQNGNRQEQVLRIVGSENSSGPSQLHRTTAMSDSNY
ncbi:putative uncharacterized protein DDB_G0286901 [Sitodiplosis mosellana]|uniref:putative uncharacterized protein DDB_G0286901 n=1 Tax=Sitodiplosis mosellana TaxID=263140 RepID=UPI002444C5C0|nr:putative uncharacterized protein DDB_G0286901 [Sitodiplosis mosellana]